MAKGFKNYSEAYLVCRDIGHAWIEDQTLAKKPGRVGSYVRILGCGRCNMTRIESLSLKGEVLFREYRQPKGYKLDFKPLVSEIRKERIARIKREAKVNV